MIKFIPLLTVALATWLIAFPVTAATVFENGTLLDTDSNILINQNQSVSNKFSLSHAIDLTSVTLGLWSRRDDAPAQLVSIVGALAPPVFGVMAPLGPFVSGARTGLQECVIPGDFAILFLAEMACILRTVFWLIGRDPASRPLGRGIPQWQPTAVQGLGLRPRA